MECLAKQFVPSPVTVCFQAAGRGLAVENDLWLIIFLFVLCCVGIITVFFVAMVSVIGFNLRIVSY